MPPRLYFKHPLESTSNVVLGGFTMYVVLGLTPGQSAAVALLCGLAEFFYHWNVATPRAGTQTALPLRLEVACSS